MTLALIGPSGAGKGTCADRLSAEFGLLMVSTGELLRENLEAHTAVGFLAKQYFARGELVPDDIVDAMVAEKLWKDKSAEGFLFDGFPRTVDQAGFLDRILGEFGQHLDMVIYLDVSNDVIEERLSQRLVCHTCHAPYHPRYRPPVFDGRCDICNGELQHRADDIPEMIRVRLRAFRQVSAAVMEYYEKSGRLACVNANGNIDSITAELEEIVRLGAKRGGGNESQIKTAANWFSDRPGRHEADKSTNIVLIGGPGSGKGTQAEELSRVMRIPHIASGDLFRENISKGTRLGRLAKEAIDRGELVSDDVTEAMVEERIAREDAAAGFVLDGFPRNLPQALALTEMLDLLNRHLDLVIYIRVVDDEIRRRISGRRICQDCQTPFHLEYRPPRIDSKCDACNGDLRCRDDDKPDTVDARLKVFHGQIALALSYYRYMGLLVDCDGEGPIDEVTHRIRTTVEDWAHHL